MSGPSSPPPGESPSGQPLGLDLLRCPCCRLLLWEPVTASCGHSFCKPCLGGAGPSRCPLCQERLELPGVGAARCSVVLCGILERCVPRERRLAGLAERVRHRLARGDARDALRMAQRGVELGSQRELCPGVDHYVKRLGLVQPGMDTSSPPEPGEDAALAELLCQPHRAALECSSLRLCRAEALLALGQLPQALEDLDAVCRAEPGHHEAFFRKGKVLLEMGQRAEALQAWEHCLTLSPHCQLARREMEKIIMEADAPQPCTAAHLGDAHLSSGGSQVDGGSPVLPSSTQTQDQEGELAEGRGGAGCEHSQDRATLPQPGPATAAESQGLLDNQEETANCTQPCLGESLSISDLECSLCIRMFFEPVTTPCGHTFCKECLERCLDHRPNCPLCKQSLREYLKAGRYSPTVLLQDIMLATFPTQLAERRELHRAEMAELSNLTKNIPIFVCTMSFPGISCPLHVFEPRYRLMIRRCQESGTRRFGMCIYENGKSFADYGCMLEIRQVELLADGRSLVDTIGRQRFRVLSRGHRDGYHTADIEFLEDRKVSGEELQELQCLHESTYRLAQRFCEHGDLTSRHILMQHGPLPEKEEDIQASADGPTWCWWLISILPLDPSYQLSLFSCTSLRARLSQLQRILTALLQQPPPRHLLPERSPRRRL